jgi:hypothetical protein
MGCSIQPRQQIHCCCIRERNTGSFILFILTIHLNVVSFLFIFSFRYGTLHENEHDLFSRALLPLSVFPPMAISLSPTPVPVSAFGLFAMALENIAGYFRQPHIFDYNQSKRTTYRVCGLFWLAQGMGFPHRPTCGQMESPSGRGLCGVQSRWGRVGEWS